MKEIDFLPEWYKSGKRREVGYRAQYMALGGVFLVMAVWSLTTTHWTAKARAEFAGMAAAHIQAEKASANLARIENKLRGLQKKFKSTEEIDSRIDVASVLAEMSFLIEETIVLSKVEFVAEKFPEKRQDKTSARTAAVVRAIRAQAGEKQQLPLGHVRFKVVIAGVAADTSKVGDLIIKLENSPYFCQVVPSFSQSVEVETEDSQPTSGGVPDTGKNISVSQFEIHCYLANYREL